MAGVGFTPRRSNHCVERGKHTTQNSGDVICGLALQASALNKSAVAAMRRPVLAHFASSPQRSGASAIS
jgi:hypothetical protein